MEKMLIVEDDPDIADLVGLHLEDLGYRLDHAMDGEEGLKKALDEDYVLVILDLMLPGMDGLEVCKRLRAAKASLPIFILTSKSEEFDKVLGLELGADDYLTKPFGVRELVARIKALLRRSRDVSEPRSGSKLVVIGALVVDRGNRKVTLDGRRVDLTAKEFDLLALFACNPGRTYTRDELLEQVWGYQYSGYEHTVNSHINRLRAKIEQDPSEPRYVLTVWGVGYRFAEKEELNGAQELQ